MQNTGYQAESYNDGVVRLGLRTTHKRLVDARREKGLTAPDLVERTGIRRGRLQAFENLRRCPTEDEMIQLAIALEKPIDYLFPDVLMESVKTGVYSKRTVDLTEPQVISLLEARRKELTYDGEETMLEEEEADEMRQKLAKLMDENLKPEERKVLGMYFGLDEEGPRPLHEVGEALGVTPERVRQIEAKALRRLHTPEVTSVLREYWPR